MRKFLERFKRITSSGNYIAEIDGLRFLAIISVVMYHIRGAFIDYNNEHGNHYVTRLEDTLPYRFLENGHQGVEIFFAISGFILALPFIKHYRHGGKKVTLKEFYLRRVTRLEPPYMLSLILLFVVALIIRHVEFHELFPNLLASMVYLHSIIFPGLPKVSAVTWSLEVEVQFYLLTPFLMRVFITSKKTTRILLLGIIVFMPILQNVMISNTNWLYKFFQYFAAGILLADLYLDKQSFLYKLNNRIFIIFGFIFFTLLLGVDGHISANLSSYAGFGLDFFQKALFPFLILSFFIIVIGNNFWGKIFSYRFIAVTGGMCYSIYLLHRAIMSMIDKYIYRIKFSDNILIDYIVSFAILSVCIVLLSSIFFVLIERPCMKKDWYKKIFKKKLKSGDKIILEINAE